MDSQLFLAVTKVLYGKQVRDSRCVAIFGSARVVHVEPQYLHRRRRSVDPTECATHGETVDVFPQPIIVVVLPKLWQLIQFLNCVFRPPERIFKIMTLIR